MNIYLNIFETLIQQNDSCFRNNEEATYIRTIILNYEITINQTSYCQKFR